MEIQSFMEAVQSRDLTRVSAMLDDAPQLANATTTWGIPALQFALYVAGKAMGHLLIERGATVDLFAAACLNDANRVEALLQENADMVHAHSADGWTALHLAGHFGAADAARALLGAGANLEARSRNDIHNTPLHAAAAGNSADLVDLLAAAGADVNATYEGGNTALHEAALHGNLAMAQALLAREAALNGRLADGRTPLALAVEKGHTAMADLLRSHGAE